MGLSEAGMIAGMVGGPALASLLAPDQQERKSFAGSDGTDPGHLLWRNQAMLEELMPLIMGRAQAGVSLPSAYVQQPGAATGGGLPMPIGLVASDPALGNPSLLKIPGLAKMGGLLDGPQTKLDPDGNPAGPRNPGTDPGGWPGDVWNKPGESGPMASASSEPMSVGPRRRSESVAPDDALFAEGDLINPGDDLQQALGSVELLLQSMRG